MPQPTTEMTWSVMSACLVAMPPVYFSIGTASMPHAIGPRAKISFCIAFGPEMRPYCAEEVHKGA